MLVRGLFWLPVHRGTDGRHDKELAQAVRSLLERAAEGPAQVPTAKRLGRRPSHTESWDLRWSVLSAIRAAMRGNSLLVCNAQGSCLTFDDLILYCVRGCHHLSTQVCWNAVN
jgi:hypothetical protein